MEPALDKVRCAICGGEIVRGIERTADCAACRVPYHPACWASTRTCAIYGCGWSDAPEDEPVEVFVERMRYADVVYASLLSPAAFLLAYTVWRDFRDVGPRSFGWGRGFQPYEVPGFYSMVVLTVILILVAGYVTHRRRPDEDWGGEVEGHRCRRGRRHRVTFVIRGPAGGEKRMGVRLRDALCPRVRRGDRVVAKVRPSPGGRLELVRVDVYPRRRAAVAVKAEA